MRARRPRIGYTLLEVILATSIALVLLAALFATLKLHLTTAQWGPEEAERAQTSRALVEQMRRDIAHLVMPIQQNVTGTTGKIGDRRISNSQFSGVRGGERWIEIFVDDSIVAADRDTSTRVGISRVRYEVTPIGGAILGDRNRSGWSLTRVRVPAEYATAWDRERIDSNAWARASELTSGLTDMRFAYWNGESWNRTWDPSTNESPPAAIRVDYALRRSSLGGRSEDPFQKVVLSLGKYPHRTGHSLAQEFPTNEPIPEDQTPDSRRPDGFSD